MSAQLREANIKLGILKLLEGLALLDTNAAIASELAVAGHKRRIDLAVFGAKTVGIEIKSEVDTLKRLQDQTATYLPYFDDLLVIVAERHIQKAVAIAPPQASVWSVAGEGAFALVRAPTQEHKADLFARLRWLTLRDLRRLAGPEYRLADRSSLVAALRNVPHGMLEERLGAALRLRFGASTKAFRSSLNEQLQPSDAIARLSRSYERRLAEKALAERSKELWSKWGNPESFRRERLSGSKR